MQDGSTVIFELFCCKEQQIEEMWTTISKSKNWSNKNNIYIISCIEVRTVFNSAIEHCNN